MRFSDARAPWLISVAIAAVASGCSTPSPSEAGCDAGSAAAMLALGSGNPNNASTFVGLNDGDTVGMVPGPQGGQHVWIQIHATGICPDHPHVELRVVRTDTQAVIGFARYSGNTWMTAPGSGTAATYTSIPYPASIDQDQYCQVLHGGMVQVLVHVDDTVGHVANASVLLRIDGWVPGSAATDVMSRDACCADYTNTGCWPLGPPDAGDAAPLDAIVGDAAE
jgi:hypothetical protein